MTIDERLEKLAGTVAQLAETVAAQATNTNRTNETLDRVNKTLDRQSAEMDNILASFREFREDRWHINRALRQLTENVDRVSANVGKLETLFTRSLTKPPNGKTD